MPLVPLHCQSTRNSWWLRSSSVDFVDVREGFLFPLNCSLMKSSSSFATARASRTASLQRPPVCSSATQQYKRKRRRTTCCASRIFVFAAIALSHNSAQADAMRWSSDLLRLMYVCTISTTTSSALSEWKQHQSKAKLSRRDFNLLILRGGTNNGNSEANEEDYVSNELTDDREKKTNLLSWIIGSFFDMTTNTKSEASVEQKNEEIASPSSRTSSKSSLSQNTGRGGALVKEKSAALSSIFQWLAPLDTMRVAPSAARLLKDEEGVDDSLMHDLPEQPATQRSSSTTSRITNSVIASAKSIGRVWWVNTWAEMLSDEKDEELLLPGANDVEGGLMEALPLDVDNDDEESEIQKTPAASPITSIALDSKGNKKKSKELNDLFSKSEDEIEVDGVMDGDALFDAAKSENESKIVSEVVSYSDRVTALRPTTTEPGKLIDSTSSITTDVNFASVDLPPTNDVSPYISSGAWRSIDKWLTMGYVDEHPSWRLSSHLRNVRKAVAKATGLHGVLSGKPRQPSVGAFGDEQLGLVRRRLAAIDRARRNVERASAIAANVTTTRRFFFRNRPEPEDTSSQYSFIVQKGSKEKFEEERRKERVKEIDRQMHAAQRQLMQLACEKDVLQRRPNPLWNYTADISLNAVKNDTHENLSSNSSIVASRQFNFPPADLVDEYLDMLFSSGRLVRLNHTDLWRNSNTDEYDDEDELTSPTLRDDDRKRRNGSGGSGSWLLRNGLGEKIGETAETAAYKAVCSAVMSVLAKSISCLHGVNVMTYSDIRLSTEQAPVLPPISAGIIPGSSQNRNYAHQAIQDAMRRGAKKSRLNEPRENFIQRDAVVETLTSQCQIAAPLLKLFPLAWQRAMLSNVVTMVTAVMSDFCEGIEFQILGHRLSFAFTPITEQDMIRGMVRDSFNNPRRTNPERFEAAVRATAEEVGENLKFLDRWHERALGSGMLRTQIATLIARLVLTLIDDVLCGSRMDLWAAHAGGPRLLAALEYRTTPSYMDDAGRQ